MMRRRSKEGGKKEEKGREEGKEKSWRKKEENGIDSQHSQKYGQCELIRKMGVMGFSSVQDKNPPYQLRAHSFAPGLGRFTTWAPSRSATATKPAHPEPEESHTRACEGSYYSRRPACQRHSYWARMLLKPAHIEPVLHGKKPVTQQESSPLLLN